MAVAVKTSPDARSSGALASPAALSLLGVLYLLGCLAIVFKAIPSLWWPAWEGLGWGSAQFVGGSLLLLACLGAAAGFLWLGALLLGRHAPEGVRAGVFVGFVGFLLVLVLTRWASLWFEHWAYVDHSVSPSTGAILTGIAGGLFLAAWVRIFTRPKVQDFVIRLEQGGWFQATGYKSNQGLRVRRGTIIGLLLLIGAGVYTLVSHGTLKRGSPDWTLSIPFTGKALIEDFGDAQTDLAALPASAKQQVEVRWPGTPRVTGLQAKQVLSSAGFKEKVLAIADDPAVNVPDQVKVALKAAADKDIVDFLLQLNRQIHGETDSGLERLFVAGLFREDVRRRLRELDQRTPWADISEYVAAVKKDTDTAVATLNRENAAAERALADEKAKKRRAIKTPAAEEARAQQRRSRLLEEVEATRWAFELPTAVVLVDRYVLQDVNNKVKPDERVRVGVNRNPNFKLKEGEIVSTEEFGRAEVACYVLLARDILRGSEGKKILAELRTAKDGSQFKGELTDQIGTTIPPVKTQLETLRSRVRDEIIPERQTLAAASGPTRFASIPLLPAVQFTMPLLLLALALWLSWRVVNMPTFADFLIATEAELNKVSWTTQRRLAQDTVVVLATVFLMSVFLFSMDYFWKTVLSWKPIGVLHIPEDSGKQKEKLEEKRW